MTGNRFIVIEGLDATGKSTLVNKLAKCLDATLLACPPLLEASDLSEGDLKKRRRMKINRFKGADTVPVEFT